MCTYDFVPGFEKALERTPAAREALAGLRGTVSRGRFGDRQRALIALAVAHTTRNDYCVWAQGCNARAVGLTGEEMLLASCGTALDPRDAALVALAVEISRTGSFSVAEACELEKSPLLETADVLEVLANAALGVLTNYLLQSVAPVRVPSTVRRS